MRINKPCEWCLNEYACRKDKISYSRFCSRTCTVKNSAKVTNENRIKRWNSESAELTYKVKKESFEKFFNKGEGCWKWNGTRGGDEDEYGRFTFRGKQIRAHRASYELYKGEIPNKFYVLHTCDVRYCVNPNHLFLGTQSENMKDMAKKGRSVPRRKLTDDQIIEIKNKLKSGATTTGLAKDFNVSSTCIWYIKHNKSWSKLKE